MRSFLSSAEPKQLSMLLFCRGTHSCSSQESLSPRQNLIATVNETEVRRMCFCTHVFHLVFHHILLPLLLVVIIHHILRPSNFLPANWDFLSLNLLLCGIIILGFDTAMFWSWWPGSWVSPGTTSTVCNSKYPLCALCFWIYHSRTHSFSASFCWFA